MSEVLSVVELPKAFLLISPRTGSASINKIFSPKSPRTTRDPTPTGRKVLAASNGNPNCESKQKHLPLYILHSLTLLLTHSIDFSPPSYPIPSHPFIPPIYLPTQFHNP